MAARMDLADVLRVWNADRTPASSSEGARLASWKPHGMVVGRKKRIRAQVAVTTSPSSGGLSRWEGHQDRSTSSRDLMKQCGWNRNNDLPPVSLENLEEWTWESVTEIVRNIGQAPFLVHLFSNADGSKGESAPSSTSSVRVETEPVASQDWQSIKRTWESGGKPKPDGIILVEELDDKEDEDSDSSDDIFAQRSTKKTLGLLVQGRGVDYSACYILDTCRVMSSAGACTHFCLVRSNCFGDTAEVQLRNAWLQKYY